MSSYIRSEARAMPGARAAAQPAERSPAGHTQSGTKGAWFVRAFTDGFLDASKTPLSDRAFRVFLVLDGRAAMAPFCYPSNDWICEKAGKNERSLREIFAELEESDWLLRAYTDETRKERIGFILLRRVDTTMPAAENTAEGIKRATQAMQEAIARCDGGNPPSRPGVSADFRR